MPRAFHRLFLLILTKSCEIGIIPPILPCEGINWKRLNNSLKGTQTIYNGTRFILGLFFDYIMTLIIGLQSMVLTLFFPLFQSFNGQPGLPVDLWTHLVFSYPKTLVNALVHITFLFPLVCPYIHSLATLPAACILWRQSWMCIIQRPKSSDILKREQ